MCMMMVWGFIVCLLLWTNSSSTIVKWQLFWSRQIGVRNLLFWEKKQFNLFHLPFSSCQWHLSYTIILDSSQCSLCLQFKIILLVHKIDTQRSSFTDSLAFGPHTFFWKIVKQIQSLNCYFKYLFYFLYICSPINHLTLWLLRSPW